MSRPIIIDCDPGIDDAVALMMAFAAPEFEVVGITSVGGNVGADETTRNALALAELAGSDVPVARGADSPLAVEKRRAASVHGADGLGGVGLPAPKRAPEPMPAWEFIRDAAARLDGALELVTIGPLTNVAIALTAYPKLSRLIKRIHMMGGSAGLGNVTPAAEFNIHVDPHAAQAVFSAGVPIDMYGLDVTSKAALSSAGLSALKALGGRVVDPICRMLDHYLGVYRGFGRDSLALHDPLVIANMIDPSIVGLKPYRVEVETNGEFTAGKTVVDTLNILKKTPNARVGMEIDNAKFLALFERLLRSYDGAPADASSRGTPGGDTSGGGIGR